MIANPALKESLQNQLSRHYSRPLEITSFSRSRWARPSSFWLEELHVTLDDGNRLDLVFKSQGPSGLLDSALRSRLDPPYDPRCEAMTYSNLLDSALGTAVCYGAEVDSEKDRYWLFLEKVPGIELSDVGKLSVWNRVAEWLARFHRSTRNKSRLWDGIMRYDAEFYNSWAERAHDLIREQSPTYSDAFAELISHYDEIVLCLASLPPVIVHGEFYPPNIIVQLTGESVGRICPVDWGTTAIAPGLIDLAALVSGTWGEREQTEIVRAYLSEGAVTQHGSEKLWNSLVCCRIHLLMQWISQSSGSKSLKKNALSWAQEAADLYEQFNRLKG